MKRLLALALLIACDNGAIVLNAAPAVSAVGPVTAEADGLHVYVWVRDHERQAVDLQLTVLQGGQATAVVSAGGHGLRGLTSDRSGTGEPHELILDTASFGSAPLSLRFVPVDTEGAAGDVFTTAEFTLAQGLPTP